MYVKQPFMPSDPTASVDALAQIATATHAVSVLMRGGSAQRAAKLIDAGMDVADAVATAAKQGKGHLGELHQASHFTARAGALGAQTRARPNPKGNHRKVDVEVIRGTRRVRGAQLKVGTAAYVKRAIRSGNYDDLIANVEALSSLPDHLTSQVADRLVHDGIAAGVLSASEAESITKEQLRRRFVGELPVTPIELLGSAAAAGINDGIVTFVLNMAMGYASAVVERRPFDVSASAQMALQGSIRSIGRTCIEAGILLQQFTAHARDRFSARLLKRIAGSRHLVSAIAEVILETATDFGDVLRKRITFEELLRRFGVHCFSAGGSMLGVTTAIAMTRGQPWWVVLLASAGLGYVGGKFGTEIGEAICGGPVDPRAVGLQVARARTF